MSPVNQRVRDRRRAAVLGGERAAAASSRCPATSSAWRCAHHRLTRVPKTLTGEELVLDDGPARESELFLVDGNNLAYRAFFALPEELQTTDGQPTNALLGFTNMLFKLLSDYQPRGVAVAWDTRPVHRKEIAAEYKADRRAMPDLLREQFPHFRPIVEAFGYRNLEFEGWEADDVIATLATRADESGVKTCVVSTDRDAFQLVSENVCLMMTPRGVADVQVYTPETRRGPLRDPARPDPGLHRAQGRHERQHPGHPRDRRQDGRPADLPVRLARGGRRRTQPSSRPPARGRSPRTRSRRRPRSSSPRCDATSTSVSTPPDLVLQPPDRSELKEIFRRFEFRGLLSRVDTLDEALPAAERPRAEPETRPLARGRRRGAAGSRRRRRRRRADRGRDRRRRGHRRVDPKQQLVARRHVAAKARERKLQVVARAELAVLAHDAKPLRLGEPVADDTMLLAYLIDPGRAEYDLDDLMAEYGVELEPDPLGGGGDGCARPARRGDATPRRATRREGRRARVGAALPRRRASADRRARGDGGRGRPHRHLPHGRDHRPPLGPDRGARVARVRARRRGVRARVAVAARPDPLREARAHAGPQGQDRVLDRREGAARDPRRSRDRPRDRGVARAHEAREHVPRAVAVADRRRRPPAHDDQPDRRRDRAPVHVEPEPAGDPDPHRARPRDPLGVRRRARTPPALGRLLADRAAHPRARLGRAEAARGVRARRGHPPRDRRRGARQGSRDPDLG